MLEASTGARSPERDVAVDGATAHTTAAADGPRVLFFSGGSALRELSHHLKFHTHNSIHVITAFDSGGSSAPLRKAFGMLAIGDLRNRLLALVDDEVEDGVSVASAFSYRLPQNAPPHELRAELQDLALGNSTCLRDLSDSLRGFACRSLVDFMDRMPADFDLRGASVGNLILASRYLSCGNDIEETIAEFSSLTNVRGLVLPVANADLTLVAHLQNGSRIVGQHRITGSVPSPIESISLVEDAAEPSVASPIAADEGLCRLVRDADLICFPMGSFFTSVLANLLPRGIGRAIAAAPCRKVYVPNAGEDPEELGYSIEERLDRLQSMVERDCDAPFARRRAVDTVLIDSRNVSYPGGCNLQAIRDRGVDILDVPLAFQLSSDRLDAQLLVPVLCALASRKAA